MESKDLLTYFKSVQIAPEQPKLKQKEIPVVHCRFGTAYRKCGRKVVCSVSQAIDGIIKVVERTECATCGKRKAPNSPIQVKATRLSRGLMAMEIVNMEDLKAQAEAVGKTPEQLLANLHSQRKTLQDLANPIAITDFKLDKTNQGMFRKAKPVPCVPVRFFEDSLCIDPDTITVYRLQEGRSIPVTAGYQVNVGLSSIPRPKALCVGTTRACNLRCRYCYVKNDPHIHGVTQGAHIEPATFGKAIELLDPNQPSISFFGGEPLLRFKAIQEMVDIARAKLKNPKFHVTTNGTLMNEEMATYFAENQFTFIVSIDGLPELHNMNRPLAVETGLSSFDSTMRCLNLLRDHGVKTITLRSTFTKDNHPVKAIVEALNKLCRQGYGNSASIEPVSSSEASCIDPEIGRTLGFNFQESFAVLEDYKEAFEWCLLQARMGQQVYWHHLNHFAQRILSHQPSLTECGAAKGYFHVTPDGSLYACHREPGKPCGTVDDGLDESVRAGWQENRLYAREDCPTCWCRYICGGGCRADSIVHVGNIRKPYASACNFMQICIAATIWVLTQLNPSQYRYICPGWKQS